MFTPTSKNSIPTGESYINTSVIPRTLVEVHGFYCRMIQLILQCVIVYHRILQFILVTARRILAVPIAVVLLAAVAAAPVVQSQSSSHHYLHSRFSFIQTADYMAWLLYSRSSTKCVRFGFGGRFVAKPTSSTRLVGLRCQRRSKQQRLLGSFILNRRPDYELYESPLVLNHEILNLQGFSGNQYS